LSATSLVRWFFVVCGILRFWLKEEKEKVLKQTFRWFGSEPVLAYLGCGLSAKILLHTVKYFGDVQAVIIMKDYYPPI
jgi:hypothetical protein